MKFRQLWLLKGHSVENKTTADYAAKKEVATVPFGGRLPMWKKQKVMEKIKKDGIASQQALIEAMVERYLDE